MFWLSDSGWALERAVLRGAADAASGAANGTSPRYTEAQFTVDKCRCWARDAGIAPSYPAGEDGMTLRLPVWIRPLISLPIRSVRLGIREGPNQTLKWSLAAAGRGWLSGSKERRRFEALAHLVSPGDCFWDVGAHRGYVTLLAARRVGRAGRVIAFEPSSQNLWYLRNHIRWNQLDKVQVVPVALGATDGTSRFGGTGSSVSFRLGRGNEIVTVRSADSLIREGIPSPTFLKVDIEGAEAEFLRGATHALEGTEIAVISVHRTAAYHDCVSQLASAGFVLHRDVRTTQFCDTQNRWWSPDLDLIAVRRHAGERRAKIAELQQFEEISQTQV